MGGVDEAPALRQLRPLAEQGDGPAAMGGEAILDLLDLFGDMDVDRALRESREQRAQLLPRHRPQRMRRDAEAAAGIGPRRRPRALADAPEQVEIADEAPLALARRQALEAGMGVEDRQNGDAEARRLRRGDAAAGKLGRVGIGPPVAAVMEVVELADRGEAGLQHLDIGERGDGLDILRLERQGEAVHPVAPGPERILARARDLGHAGHAALEGVGVQVRQAGQGDPRYPHRAGFRALADRGDSPVRADRHGHVVAPALGRQRPVQMELVHRRLHATVFRLALLGEEYDVPRASHAR